MIKLPYGYGIKPNDCGGYIFGKLTIQNRKKQDGTIYQVEDIIQAIYPSTIESCIKELFRIKLSERIDSKDMELKEFLVEFNKLKKEFESILKQVLSEEMV